MKTKTEDLRWVRAFSPDLIPKYLIDQVRDRDYSVEDFYKFQDINCLIHDQAGSKLNPFNHLYVLANDDNLVKGFLWFVVDPLSKDMIINTFSMDKAHWKNGEAVKFLSDHVKEIQKKLKLEKVYWLTNYPKHSERHGFKRSRSVLMEYKEEKNGQDIEGEQYPQGEHKLADSGATATF